jgi:hypothetical protein
MSNFLRDRIPAEYKFAPQLDHIHLYLEKISKFEQKRYDLHSRGSHTN